MYFKNKNLIKYNRTKTNIKLDSNIYIKNRLNNTYIYKIHQDQLYFNNIRNINQLVNINKISINTTNSYFMNKPNTLINLFYILYIFTNTRPDLVKSRKSIAGFKLRKDMLVGLKVNITDINNILDIISRVADNSNKVTTNDKNINISSNTLAIFKELNHELDKGLNNKTVGFDMNISLNSNISSLNYMMMKYLNIINNIKGE